MPSWKRVIVSGSNAALNSLTVTNGATISGSITLTGSITSVNYIDFNTSYAATQPTEGRLSWNSTDGTLNLGMKGGLATQQIGQETYYPPVVNKTASILREGTLVMINPTTPSFGNRLNVIKAITDGTYPTDLLVGIITEDIAINGEGFATWFGYVRNLNQSNLETYGIKRAGETWAEGNILYPDPLYQGGLTNVEPSAPSLKSTIAAITSINGQNITILVRPTFKFKLEELSNVGNTSQNGDLLTKSGSIWTSTKQLTGSYGLTGSLQATSFTGSLFGTASYASTASFVPNTFLQDGNSFGTTALLGTNDNQSLAFETSGSTRMFISSSGNVGIGTSIPSTPLHVSSAAATPLLLERSTANANVTTQFKDQTASWYIGKSSNDYFSIGREANLGATTIFNITPLGSIGVGIITPTFKLHVVGDLYASTQIVAGTHVYSPNITNPSTANNSQVLLSNSGTRVTRNIADSNTVFAVTNSNASSTGAIQTWNNSAGELMRVTQTGNVGIGTTTPNSKLDVNGNTTITGSLAVSQSLLQYSNIASVTSGSTSNVASFNTSSYTAAFFDYVTTSGTSARAGTVFTVWNGNNVEYTETSTNDIGNTNNLVLSASLSAGAIRLQATSLSGSWSVKTLARMI